MAKVAKRRGRYVLDYYDNENKRVRKVLPAGTTLKKAKDKLREIEDQLAKGLYIADEKIPIFSTVAEEWLKKKKPELRDSTWSVYEGHTKNHFSDFENIRIDRITIAMIEEWITERQNEKMPIATIRKILVSMGQIFKYAVRHKYISYNPFPDVERPRGRVKSDSVMVLTPKQLTTFFDAVKDKKYKTLFMLAVFSGARQGELLGLKWSDMDYKNNQIQIQRTYNHQTFYETKTETSNRKVDLGPTMIAQLRKWQLACPPNRLNLIFPNESGQPMNYSNMVQRYYMPTLKNAKIERIKVHCLRHTFASLLIHQGENIKYIQSQLGHSSPTVTLNVYSHLMKPVNQESASRLEKSIFQGTGHKMVTNG
jgi:integrase